MWSQRRAFESYLRHLGEKVCFKEAHGGLFGGRLRDSKIHSELSKHYCGRPCEQIYSTDAERVLPVPPAELVAQ